MRRIFGSVYCWLGLGFVVYAIVRAFLELGAHLPNDVSSTLITLTLLLLGGILVSIAYWQVR
ncbi:MAG: hypothetical protein NVS3B14_03840 [Ktedonobacteraceae bacterium]